MCRAVSLFVLVRRKTGFGRKREENLYEAVFSECLHLKRVKILNIYNCEINIKKIIDMIR